MGSEEKAGELRPKEVLKVAAVIPVWNEAQSLGPLLDELREFPEGTLQLVVVADNHSTDGTPELARERGAHVVTQSRRGYGAACWEGFETAREMGATHLLFLDGDGSDPPAAIPAMLDLLRNDGADLVLGVRRAPPGETDPVPWHARAGNALVCGLLRLRTGRRVSDLPSMKALSVARLEALNMQEMGFGWTTELIAKALRRGYRVREVPLTVRPRTAGVSKVSGNLRNSARAAADLLRTALQATA